MNFTAKLGYGKFVFEYFSQIYRNNSISINGIFDEFYVSYNDRCCYDTDCYLIFGLSFEKSIANYGNAGSNIYTFLFFEKSVAGVIP